LGIGYKGTQPLVLSADRRRFRELTYGKTIIVGRKTLEDSRAESRLKNRRNIVLSSRKDLVIDGAESRAVGEGAQKNLPGYGDTVVVGGESVYISLLDMCKRAFVTRIETDTPADRFFPDLDTRAGWRLAEHGETMEENGVRYRFDIYENENI
jgi:dihydrofolate reductase